MGESHFIVSTVAGVMLAACQKAISPNAARGAIVGKRGRPCPECQRVVDEGWITL